MKEHIIAFTDMHTEIIDNAEERINILENYIRYELPDYIINLGDFGYFKETSYSKSEIENMPVNLKNAYLSDSKFFQKRAEKLFTQLKKINLPLFSIFGNHDLDFSNKEIIRKIYEMPGNYYSKEIGNAHLIFLDTSSYKNDEGVVVSYDYGNYNNHLGNPTVDKEQLNWLSEELNSTKKPVIVLSHYPLNKDSRGIENWQDIQHIFNEFKAKNGKILACFNGHSHIDRIQELDNTVYITLNSMSYFWNGTEYTKNYDQIDQNIFPNMQYVERYPYPIFYDIVLSKTQLVVQEAIVSRVLRGEHKDQKVMKKCVINY